MLDVIIVNWNAGPQLKICVDSITQLGGGLVDKIIVVDNDSVDASMGSIAESPSVTAILCPENLGFAKACNLGAQHASSDYLLFLNPDAKLHPGTLQQSLTFMMEPDNARIGICGVKLLDDKGIVTRGCARLPTVMSTLANAIGIDRISPKMGYVMREWEHDSTKVVDHVIGAYYFVRRSVFASLQGFDEAFFLYLEDVDFSKRAKDKGFGVAYLGDTVASHTGGGTSKQIKARRLYFSLQSRLIYSSKHFSRAGAFSVHVVTLAIEPIIRLSHSAVVLSGNSVAETWTAYRLLFAWYFKGFWHK